MAIRIKTNQWNKSDMEIIEQKIEYIWRTNLSDLKFRFESFDPCRFRSLPVLERSTESSPDLGPISTKWSSLRPVLPWLRSPVGPVEPVGVGGRTTLWLVDDEGVFFDVKVGVFVKEAFTWWKLDNDVEGARDIIEEDKEEEEEAEVEEEDEEEEDEEAEEAKGVERRDRSGLVRVP